ncbi:MAG: hypothetical protein MUO63_01345 [Desulfobulbaceae bacterium]|nr:hypothetical protein [Desulfobulbaceae bacterium]
MKKLTSILVAIVLVLVFAVTSSAGLIHIGTAQFAADGPAYPLLWDDGPSVVWLDYTAPAANQLAQIAWAAALNTTNPLDLTFNEGVTVTFEGAWRLANTQAEVTVGLRTSGLGFSNLNDARYYGSNYWEPDPGYYAGEIYNPLAVNGFNEYQHNTYDGYGAALRSAKIDIAPAVPLPGAVWLLGSGLLGILRLRRKKD